MYRVALIHTVKSVLMTFEDMVKMIPPSVKNNFIAAYINGFCIYIVIISKKVAINKKPKPPFNISNV